MAFMEQIRKQMQGKQKCVKCGCTQERACPEGCYWVAPNKCSRCFPPAGEKLKEIDS